MEPVAVLNWSVPATGPTLPFSFKPLTKGGLMALATFLIPYHMF